MSANPAKNKKINVSVAGAEWKKLPATSGSFNHGPTVLDDTELANDGYRSRLLGLRDWSVSVAINWKATDDAITIVKNHLYSGADLHVQYLPDGTNGLEGECVIEGYNLGGGVDELETGDITLQGNGLLSEVPE